MIGCLFLVLERKLFHGNSLRQNTEALKLNMPFGLFLKRVDMQNKKTKPQGSHLKIIPIGGCEQFGMNMTCYSVGKKFIVVDSGTIFPEARLLGVNSIIPDISNIFSELGKLCGYVITHGHEDHIGALPFLFQNFPAPIYSTAWTSELISLKFKKNSIHEKWINTVKNNEQIKIKPFSIDFFPVHHSIPDACSLLIKTKEQSVFHTGDFKIDPAPDKKEQIDFKKLSALGKDGIDLMLADSTNSFLKGRALVKKALFLLLKK